MSTMENSRSADTPTTEAREGIPVLDLAPLLRGEPGALEDLGDKLRWAFGSIGFLYITNHGVPLELIDRVFRQNARIHSRPDPEKLKVLVNANPGGNSFDGYMPSGVQRVRSFDQETGKAGRHDNAKADVGEAFFMTQALRLDPRADKWPKDLPGFSETLVEYFDALEDLCKHLLRIIAVGLEMPQDFFLPFFEESTSSLRLSHYPPTPLEDGQYNTSPHSDGSFITLLAQSEVPGLQIYRRSREWLPAPVRHGDFLVNSAELLRLWSNDRLLSTPHRVINASGRDRYAIPFFYSPKRSTLIECLPTCRDAEHPAKYQPITAGDYLAWFMRENFAGGKYR